MAPQESAAVIGIMDVGGNQCSVRNSLATLNIGSVMVSVPAHLSGLKKLIIPGVASTPILINKLKANEAFPLVLDLVKQQDISVLGICAGFQSMADSVNEFGVAEGLGWIKGAVQKITGEEACDSPLRLPHMGWNSCEIEGKSKLFHAFGKKEIDLYFAHSYYFEVSDRSSVVATTMYGRELDVAVESENIFGVQFHPEKSGLLGLSILQNFYEKC